MVVESDRAWKDGAWITTAVYDDETTISKGHEPEDSSFQVIERGFKAFVDQEDMVMEFIRLGKAGV